MDHQGQFRRAALALSLPDDEVGRFIEHLRLSIRLSGGSRGVPVGQFRGLPRLPVDEDWPSDEFGQLPFIFSVDCALLPRIDGFDLPVDGSLLFFLNHEKDHLATNTGDQQFSRVVHVPAGTETAVAEPSDFQSVGKQYDVSATLSVELPTWLAPDEDEEEEDEDEDDHSPFQQQLARDLEREMPHLDELCALAYDLWPPDEGFASAYIGGYVDDEVIESLAGQTLVVREMAGEIVIQSGKWYSQLEQEQHRLTSEWMSLAIFSLDEESYYGSFAVRHDDLAAGRLDKAFSVTTISEYE
ncbi:protein of unknown function (DUF1963) [Promicromonospora umidemergens]|uniref:DUF1963 domain-containing protein n=2 Tax=Promicromonospora umidemergens TaxID=629679 RepID=A0ABP8X2M1_9MICO|nr:protein of unknown function (DUF1963) [Promicromonospora umidemergens]